MDSSFVMQYSSFGRLSAANGRLGAAVNAIETTASRGFGERARIAQDSNFLEIVRGPGCRQLIQMVCPTP